MVFGPVLENFAKLDINHLNIKSCNGLVVKKKKLIAPPHASKHSSWLPHRPHGSLVQVFKWVLKSFAPQNKQVRARSTKNGLLLLIAPLFAQN